MKKIIIVLSFVAIALFGLTSCVTEAYAYDGTVDIEIRYGEPYYDVTTRYYVYPYFYDNRWRYYRSVRPIPRAHVRRYITPPVRRYNGGRWNNATRPRNDVRIPKNAPQQHRPAPVRKPDFGRHR